MLCCLVWFQTHAIAQACLELEIVLLKLVEKLGSCLIVQARLELTILLTQLPELWNYELASLHLTKVPFLHAVHSTQSETSSTFSC